MSSVTVSISEAHHSMLRRGSTQRWALRVAESSLGPLDVPLLTCRGQQPGPVALVVAGVHGDEFEGMAAIRRVFARLDPAQLHGTAMALPVANPWAYEAQSRESPSTVDGKNLARVFPGHDRGSATDRLAAALFAFVLRNATPADLLIDLHSGGTRYRYLPMVGYRAIDNAALAPSIEAARHFGIDRLWRMPDSVGPLNAESARAGIPTIGTEITGQGGRLPRDVAVYADGILNCLRHQGMLHDARAPRCPRDARDTSWLTVTAHGMFEPTVDLGDEVAAGQVLATVVDHDGEARAEVRAGHDGQVWAIRSFPTVRPDDIAFVLAER